MVSNFNCSHLQIYNFIFANYSWTKRSPATGVMELWMRSYSSELFSNCELFLDKTLSCHWSYGTLDEVLQQWTLSQSWIVPWHNSPAPGVMEHWMRSYSSEFFPNHELFLDTTLSCHWSYGTLAEVLQKWTLPNCGLFPYTPSHYCLSKSCTLQIFTEKNIL